MKHFTFKPNLLLLGILICYAALANGQTISGKVTSADDNKALSGVSVMVKGTGSGTTSDANGLYNLTVPNGNAVLVFSIMGYNAKEVMRRRTPTL